MNMMTIPTDVGTDEILDVINQIAATSSKNEKVAIIAANQHSDTFKRVLLAALDPLVTYGVQKLPEPLNTLEAKEFDGETWNVIAMLSSRTLTGNDAQSVIASELGNLTDNSAELFRRIILKDLKAGFGDSSVNKAIKGLIPEFPYMRCSLPKDAKLNDWAWDDGVISQEKADGTYTNCDFADGEVRLTSRQGSQYPLEQFSELVAEIKATFDTDTQTHGEIVVLRDGMVLPREIGNGIMNHVANGGVFGPGETPQFQVWEQIPLHESTPKNTYKMPYIGRLKHLARQLSEGTKAGSIKLIPTKVVYSLGEATDHFREMLKAGKEGTVMKEPNSPWKDGTSKFQVKRKLDVDVELEVIGFEDGKGKNTDTFGSLICKSSEGALIVSVSGFTDKMRLEIHQNRDNWLGSIITVKFNAIMRSSEAGKPHSLFLPRFVELRMDKSVADSFDRVVDQYEAAINEV
jgi:DNA ligase-1